VPKADIVQCSNWDRYSINSSARASSVCGISTPSALAVRTLITISYLVGSWIGRSPGFSGVLLSLA